MNYARFLTAASQLRKPSIIREATKALATASPELVFLGGGYPNPNTFPFDNINFKVKDGPQIEMSGKLLESALQYGPTLGYPPLVKQLKSLIQRLHSPPCWEESELIVTSGSQDGLAKSIEMMINYGDFFLTHVPVYTGTLSILDALNPQYLPIESDNEGMIPQSLLKALSKWDPATIRSMSGNVPKVIYVNPNAVNPTGTSMTTDRKKAVYEIACKFDLIILEDDPYYFVQFEALENYAPSFLSLDVEGRVLRFDSFSKVFSSGIRIGFLTGPKQLVKQVELHMQSSILHASSLSQVTVSELLKVGKEDGFLRHTTKIQDFYLTKRNMMLNSAEKHLKDLCTWVVPTGGMFLWLECPHLKDTTEMLVKRSVKKDVLMIPGKFFYTDQWTPCNKMRASFSVASEPDIDRAFRNLAELIREEIDLQNSS